MQKLAQGSNLCRHTTEEVEMEKVSEVCASWLRKKIGQRYDCQMAILGGSPTAISLKAEAASSTRATW